MNKSKIIKISAVTVCTLFLAFFALVIERGVEFKNYVEAEPLDLNQSYDLQDFLVSHYPQEYEILKSLPYSISEQNLDVWAESAILIDIANGNVLYEKNADEVIPPASMTKLFAMYLVDEEVSAGNLTYDQLIPLPPESWACNMPPHSSLMFLGEGQQVTLEELLLGLSICSGNDAAYALAYTISGTMEAFVERMNQVAFDLGLEHTRFVESSGYSELNTTTAREMAAFCRIYLENHPDSLARYHAVQSFTYPKEKNLAPGDKLAAQDFSNGFPRHITMSITQRNTNPLIGILDGVDGLKTGYIDESGYNLSLTARRNGTRYLSVTMKGPGKSSAEGQKGRIHDGTQLMEWAFSTFADYDTSMYVHPYFVKSYGAKQKGFNLIPVSREKILSVPFITGDSLEENLDQVKVYLNFIDNGWGDVQLGDECGTIKFMINDYTLQTIPLIADRNITKANVFISMADWVVLKLKTVIT